MALPVAALDIYCITIFETGSRTLSQFHPAWQEEIKTHAVQFKRYQVTVYDTTLTAGRITQAQYDAIVGMIPPAASPAAERQIESTE
ncbi:hypothetical protein [Paenibacillus hunanensis]|uniref:Uncharacterized protein n=1 Tax=Paenibacillus hunanensis TaxID=539262 RepID=A0ABU1IV82_9BACL|nr:hypothetical protein [Paenibacillus hunanensis]MDR6243133.1 hypothetical protein [Paenibacillus hunanensis]GGJ11572.1 hypothetical protein GCM10008022_20920 [Paenibacillus hunanensis]